MVQKEMEYNTQFDAYV